MLAVLVVVVVVVVVVVMVVGLMVMVVMVMVMVGGVAEERKRCVGSVHWIVGPTRHDKRVVLPPDGPARRLIDCGMQLAVGNEAWSVRGIRGSVGVSSEH